MTNKFVPTSDAAALSKQSAAFMRAASDLMEIISKELPAELQASMMQVIDGGGRVGLEVTVDRHANNLMSLVAVEREGRHRTLATVAVVGSGNGGVAH
ncbi:hypothetical protein [Massilia sp. DWR3-1-1]|uniref:hypothetical protein n=1 Tax=Massilia sp. DWR3-1-1 TaxID=2804559 RepID=UPI003CED6402